MKLWTVRKDRLNDVTTQLWNVCENDAVIAKTMYESDASRIADEHNAWVILAERGFILMRWENGDWGIENHPAVMEYSFIPVINRHATPVAAILAADAWLKER